MGYIINIWYILYYDCMIMGGSCFIRYLLYKLFIVFVMVVRIMKSIYLLCLKLIFFFFFEWFSIKKEIMVNIILIYW